ncbi:hypothetical protein KUCAC02_031461, partial [Chaenocephalus aceratus]
PQIPDEVPDPPPQRMNRRGRRLVLGIRGVTAASIRLSSPGIGSGAQAPLIRRLIHLFLRIGLDHIYGAHYGSCVQDTVEILIPNKCLFDTWGAAALLQRADDIISVCHAEFRERGSNKEQLEGTLMHPLQDSLQEMEPAREETFQSDDRFIITASHMLGNTASVMHLLQLAVEPSPSLSNTW